MSNIININFIKRSARLLAEENLLEHKDIIRTARDIELMQKIMDDFAPIEKQSTPRSACAYLFSRKLFSGSDRDAIQDILGRRVESDIKKLNEYIHSDRGYIKDLMEEEAEIKIHNYETKARQQAQS